MIENILDNDAMLTLFEMTILFIIVPLLLIPMIIVVIYSWKRFTDN